jgi:hypothetical protein
VFGVPTFICIWHAMRAWQKKLWQQLGSRNQASFQAIINKMYDILKMDVPGCEVKLAKVNTTLDAQLKVWQESGDKNQSAAADYFKYWRGKTGKRTRTEKHNKCR